MNTFVHINFINSAKSIGFITRNINQQLGRVGADPVPFRQWLELPDVKGAEITLWVLTTQYTDQDGNVKNGQNITTYKPAMFDAVMSGLL